MRSVFGEKKSTLDPKNLSCSNGTWTFGQRNRSTWCVRANDLGIIQQTDEVVRRGGAEMLCSTLQKRERAEGLNVLTPLA